jgi:penicillin V acylase-like amidase (Ntn superfamily)
MKGKNYCVVGFNENWKSMPGIVVVNKRGIVKKNLSWNFLVSEDKPLEPGIEWISKYGSVSFNLLGLDLPCYGVNEKGLFIVELYLDRTFSLEDSLKPKMFWGQWIQFQLDNYATVNELVEGLENTCVIDWWPTFPGSHFFVSDKEGNTAAVELINGKFQVSSGKNMPVPILCNRPYQNELKNVERYKAFGGGEIFNLYSQGWNARFPKAAHLVKNYSVATGISPVSYAWNVLDSIKPGDWQLVADVQNNILYFRSDQGKKIKSINISKCDFSKNNEVKFIDINSNSQGDITNQLSKLTPEINDEYVMKGFPIGYENPQFYNSNKYANLKKNLHNYVIDKL